MPEDGAVRLKEPCAGSHPALTTRVLSEPDAPRALPRSLNPRANIAAGINVLDPQRSLTSREIHRAGPISRQRAGIRRGARDSGPASPLTTSLTPPRVMAGLVPAIPMLTSAAPHIIEITGTGPVMTSGEAATNDRKSAAPQPSGITGTSPVMTPGTGAPHGPFPEPHSPHPEEDRQVRFEERGRLPDALEAPLETAAARLPQDQVEARIVGPCDRQ